MMKLFFLLLLCKVCERRRWCVSPSAPLKRGVRTFPARKQARTRHVCAPSVAAQRVARGARRRERREPIRVTQVCRQRTDCWRSFFSKTRNYVAALARYVPQISRTLSGKETEIGANTASGNAGHRRGPGEQTHRGRVCLSLFVVVVVVEREHLSSARFSVSSDLSLSPRSRAHLET